MNERYKISFPGSFIENITYTFPQICRIMSDIPPTAKLEVLLLSGEVHFTKPSMKIEDGKWKNVHKK